MKYGFTILNQRVSSKRALQAPFFPKNEEVQSSTIGGESSAYIVVGLITLPGKRRNS